MVLFCACFSPMRGWLRKASSQSASGRCCQQSVSGGEETLLVRKWAHRRQLRGPGAGAAAGENLCRRLVGRQRMPTRQHRVHSEQALEKLLQQIARDMEPVSGAGTNVIDGSDLRFQRLPGFANQCRTPRPAQQHFFCPAQPQRRDRHAADGQPHVFDLVVGDFAQRSQAELGDGLRIARADLARVRVVVGKSRLQRDGGDDLIGSQPGLLVAGMELDIGHAPCAASGNQQQFGLVDHQRGKGIGGGRCVHDVAAEGAAVLVGNAAGPGGRAGEQGKLLRYQRMISQVGVGASGADDQLLRGAVRCGATPAVPTG